MTCAVRPFLFILVSTTAAAAAADELALFSKIGGHAIRGHDDGGFQHPSTTLRSGSHSQEECAAACVGDRGCKSFEVGIEGTAAEGNCLLSYDTRATVHASVAPEDTFAPSESYDYFERTDAGASPLDRFTAVPDTWLPAQDTAGVFVGVTASACAQRCLHTAGCKSFDYGTPRCVDREHTGFMNAVTQKPMACSRLTLFCMSKWGGQHTAGVRASCPRTCSLELQHCYNHESCTGGGCRSRCADSRDVRAIVGTAARFTCKEAAASGYCSAGADAATSAAIRLACPVACRKQFDATNITFSVVDAMCPAATGECLLSYSTNGDGQPGAAAVLEPLALAARDDWTFHRLRDAGAAIAPAWQALLGSAANGSGDDAPTDPPAPCTEGTASQTGWGVASQPCLECPADSYSSVTRTKCVPCPAGYHSPVGSSGVHSCERAAAATEEGTGSSSSSAAVKYFSPGEVWVGTYSCSGFGNDGSSEPAASTDGSTDGAAVAALPEQGHGRIELYVLGEDLETGQIQVMRRFANSFIEGSYYMAAEARPSLHGSFGLFPKDWIRRPDTKSVLVDGASYTIEASQTALVGNISEYREGKAVFHGDMCGDGWFSLARSCSVGRRPDFVAGEHWIGSYSCVNSDNPDLTDIRRLDLLVDEVTDTHIKVINKFEHHDGEGSFRQAGNYDSATQRLHLTSDGRRTAWIRRPSSSWYTSDLDGFITDDKLTFTGTKNSDPNCACHGACDLDHTWGAESQWRCPTGDSCPNAELDPDSGEWTVGCGESVQTCSRFEVHRVCSPLPADDAAIDPCACTGQVDTAGRGGACQSYETDPSDRRGAWCHVDPACIVAGPDNGTDVVDVAHLLAAGSLAHEGSNDVVASWFATNGGVASSGLWWASCTPLESACEPAEWSWEDSECVPDEQCDPANPTGMEVGSARVVDRLASNGAVCGAEGYTNATNGHFALRTRPCVPDACMIELDGGEPSTDTTTTASETSSTTTVSATSSTTATTVKSTSATDTSITATTATFTTPTVTGTAANPVVKAGGDVEVATAAVPQHTADDEESASKNSDKSMLVPFAPCDLQCENGGVCVLQRDAERCSDSSAPYYQKVCVCPMLSLPGGRGAVCSWGDRCEQTTSCPRDTLSCAAIAAKSDDRQLKRRAAGSGGPWTNGPFDQSTRYSRRARSSAESDAGENASHGVCSTSEVQPLCGDDAHWPDHLFGSGSRPSTGEDDQEESSPPHSLAIAIAVAALVLVLIIGGVFMLARRQFSRGLEAHPAQGSYTNPVYEKSPMSMRTGASVQSLRSMSRSASTNSVELHEPKNVYDSVAELHDGNAGSARSLLNPVYGAMAQGRTANGLSNPLYGDILPAATAGGYEAAPDAALAGHYATVDEGGPRRDTLRLPSDADAAGLYQEILADGDGDKVATKGEQMSTANERESQAPPRYLDVVDRSAEYASNEEV